MNPIIKPEVINILAGNQSLASQSIKEDSSSSSIESQNEIKLSFRDKLKRFFSNAETVIKSVVAGLFAIAGLINAFSRWRRCSPQTA